MCTPALEAGGVHRLRVLAERRGDMPQSIALFLWISDNIGKPVRLDLLRLDLPCLDLLRGGLRLAAVRPQI